MFINNPPIRKPRHYSATRRSVCATRPTLYNVLLLTARAARSSATTTERSTLVRKYAHINKANKCQLLSHLLSVAIAKGETYTWQGAMPQERQGKREISLGPVLLPPPARVRHMQTTLLLAVRFSPLFYREIHTTPTRNTQQVEATRFVKSGPDSLLHWNIGKISVKVNYAQSSLMAMIIGLK